MSGTSLDGVDICYTTLQYSGKWTYRIHQTETIPYTKQWSGILRQAPDYSKDNLKETDIQYGQLLGKIVNDFIEKHEVNSIDLIASHGHTIFHQPEKKLTLQIGNGHTINTETKLPVVYDFRTQDVLLGGQGAPLVPIGDRLPVQEEVY